MVITFEVQIDPVRFPTPEQNVWEPDPMVVFTEDQLKEMKQLMEGFVQDLDRFNHYMRATMYIDGEYYRE